MDFIVQLVASAALASLAAIVHGAGLLAIQSLLNLRDRELERGQFGMNSLLRTSGTVMTLFALHAFEIWIFAGFYLLVGAAETLDSAVSYSISSFATLGSLPVLDENWEIVGASEALIGFLLLGWSTAFLVSKFEKMRA